LDNVGLYKLNYVGLNLLPMIHCVPHCKCATSLSRQGVSCSESFFLDTVMCKIGSPQDP